MSEENVELVQRLVAAFLDSDFGAVFALLDPDIRVFPRPDEPGAADIYRGHEGVVEYTVNWYSQWDEYDAEPISFRDAGDRVLLVLRERGRLKQAGIEVEQEFIHSYTVRDGKVVEWHQHVSYQQALEALGLREGTA